MRSQKNGNTRVVRLRASPEAMTWFANLDSEVRSEIIERAYDAYEQDPETALTALDFGEWQNG